MPVRIQRKRTKGFRLSEASDNPNGVVCVTRPTKWGNPFKIGGYYEEGSSFRRYYFPDGHVTAENILPAFEKYCRAHGAEWLEPLRGYDLSCWCRTDQICHADVLLRLANS